MVNIKSKLLDKNEISKTLIRLSHEIVEQSDSIENIAIIGIRTRGQIIADRILKNITSETNEKCNSGILDLRHLSGDPPLNDVSNGIALLEIRMRLPA